MFKTNDVNLIQKVQGKNLWKYIIFAILILLFLFTRLWQLTTLPYGLHIDEASMTYTAWCLSEYGVDRYLKSWPVFLKNFHGGQSALYAYLCTALFYIFGYHRLLIRIPGVFFSFLNFIFGMKIAHTVYPKDKLIPWIVGILITICPYFIMAGRFGLDCNLMLGASTVFLYFFITAIKDNQLKSYILAGISGGIVLYTYALSYAILPIFLIISFLYLLRVKQFSIKRWIAMGIPMGIMAFPLILVQIINYFDLPEFKIGCFTIPKLDIYRISEIGKISYEKFSQALNSIFLVDSLNYNSAPGHMNLYSVTIYLFVLGFIFSIIKFGISLKKKEYEVSSIILL